MSGRRSAVLLTVHVADYMGNSSSTYIVNRLNPTTETLAWHNYPHCE